MNLKEFFFQRAYQISTTTPSLALNAQECEYFTEQYLKSVLSLEEIAKLGNKLRHEELV